MSTLMQYAIYLVLGVCVVCLLTSVTVFIVMERRWQRKVERDAAAVLARARYRETVREDSVSAQQWQELRHRFEEMQIMADESGRPGPYKNVA
ncbi:hypothetical protein [Herbaspirillum sp. LeCh32-8]|uniref:hypothetical protein n=1 Tax=Herbaspirillum sp. LeCh32-8 TaxID=2821356 RepID=UPI001FD7A101|nr:hypothetical protein [Herbaspirillum sp. LeCh32-8]